MLNRQYRQKWQWSDVKDHAVSTLSPTLGLRMPSIELPIAVVDRSPCKKGRISDFSLPCVGFGVAEAKAMPQMNKEHVGLQYFECYDCGCPHTWHSHAWYPNSTSYTAFAAVFRACIFCRQHLQVKDLLSQVLPLVSHHHRPRRSRPHHLRLARLLHLLHHRHKRLHHHQSACLFRPHHHRHSWPHRLRLACLLHPHLLAASRRADLLTSVSTHNCYSAR